MVVDNYYKEYLDSRLDLIFHENGKRITSSLFSSDKTKDDKIVGVDDQEARKNNSSCGIGFSKARNISIEEALKELPELNNRKDEIKLAYRLDNAIIGLYMALNNGTNEWFFPQLKLHCSKHNYPEEFVLFNNGYFIINHYIFDDKRHFIHRYRGIGSCKYLIMGDSYIVCDDLNKYGLALLDMKGNIISDYSSQNFYRNNSAFIYDHSEDIKNDTGDIKKISFYKVVLKDGKLLNDGEPLCIYKHSRDNLILRSGEKYYVLMKDGSLLENGKVFEKITVFNYGRLIFTITHSGFGSLFDDKGKRITETSISFVENFDNNAYGKVYFTSYVCEKDSYRRTKQVDYGPYYKLINRDNKEYLVDGNGILVSEHPHDSILYVLFQKYLIVKDNEKYLIVDKDGNVIYTFDDPQKTISVTSHEYTNLLFVDYNARLFEYDHEKSDTSYFNRNNIAVIPDEKLLAANVGKIIRYHLTVGGKKIHTRYCPVKIYGDYFVLCFGSLMRFYLYNIKTKKYLPIGNLDEVFYNDSFIEAKGIMYYPYKDKLLDITDYYKEHLKGKKSISINEDIGEIFTKDEFSERYKGELAFLQLQEDLEEERLLEEEANARRELEKEEAEVQRKLKENEQEKRLQKALKKKQENERLLFKKIEEYNNGIGEFLNNLSILGESDIDIPKSNIIRRHKVKNLFVQVGDHLEINSRMKKYYSIIDFSDQTFKNVKVSGEDFRGTNATNIDPQVVYKKDLSNCNFEGINLSSCDFTGVNIKGCKLSYYEDDKTLSIFKTTIVNSIYDETTTINGLSVSEFIDGTVKLEITNKRP